MSKRISDVVLWHGYFCQAQSKRLFI